LPGAAPGKDPPAKNWPAKISLPGAFYRAPSKDFAESKSSPRQKKSDRHGADSVGLFFAGRCVRDTRQRFFNFFPRYSLPGAFWVGSRQRFFIFFLNNFFAECLVPHTRQRFLFYF